MVSAAVSYSDWWQGLARQAVEGAARQQFKHTRCEVWGLLVWLLCCEVGHRSLVSCVI
jgi:hypothetical protein